MIGRIGKDGRIVPVSITDGVVPPMPFSRYLAPGSAQAAGNGKAA
jgi:hypothetical protein